MVSRKAVFIVPSLGKGGAQRATVSLANYLATQDCYEVSVIALKEDGVEFDVEKNIQVIKLDCISFRKSLKKLVYILKKIRPDVVYSALWHVNLLATFARVILFLFSTVRFRHISSIHNNPDRIIQTENGIMAATYYYGLARFSSKVVAVSRGIQSHLIKKCRIPESKVALGYNPSITNHHKMQLDQDLMMPFVIENEGKYLLWIGRFDYQKDPIKFLDVVRLSGLPAVMAGEGPQKTEVENYIETFGLQTQILLLPFQENVMYLMARAFLLLMTSRFEGFGLVLVESLYAGTPVVSLDCLYGPNEIIENGKNGVLLREMASADEFVDAVRCLMENPTQYSTIKSNAKQSVEKFTDQVVFKTYQEFFA